MKVSDIAPHVKVIHDALMQATMSGDDSPEFDNKAIRGALDALNEMFPAEAQDTTNSKLEGEKTATDRQLRLAADAAVARRTGKPTPRMSRILDRARVSEIVKPV